MKNPYEKLIEPEVEFELVDGVFECQERTCRELVHEAKYIEEINTLTWVCSQGHISQIEDFE